MKIAIVGSGVSGIAAGKVHQQLGHEVTLFERGERLGGVWAVAYAGVHLQNLRELYTYTDFPWPFETSPFPAAAEILRYLEAAVAHYGLNVRLRHTVTGMTERPEGWRLSIDTPEGAIDADFDHVVVAAGHYTHEKADIALPGRERFAGRIVTEHEIADPRDLDGKRVAIIGFGKSAVDMASFAVGHAAEIHHIFREARWLMPRKMLGQYISRMATERMSSLFGESWAYPGKFQRLTRERNPSAAAMSDRISSALVRRTFGLRGKRHDPAAQARLAKLDPDYEMSGQFRGTLAPDNYFPSVISGAIEPHRSALEGFSETSVLLADGSAIEADIVVLAIGYKRPALPFLPEPVRTEFATTGDGVQLYRHLIHPRLRHVSFAGFNHNPLHITSAEIGAMWVDAVESGALTLPSVEAMEASVARVREWKRTHAIFEPTRAYWVGAHFHNYLDILLMELGLKHRRKRNSLAELLGHYGPADFVTLLDEYRGQRGTKRTALDFDS